MDDMTAAKVKITPWWLLHVSRWDINQIKENKLKCKSEILFLLRSYHTDVVHVSNKFGFNYIQTGLDVMIDS